MSAVLEFVETPEEPVMREPIVTETVASLNAVTKRYANGVTALDNLSLTLRRGEIVALLGPNGAGKSTAVKLLMGLSSPTSGSVRIFGADPRQTAARLRTGVMLQIGRAPEMLRVREHIKLFRGYYPNPMPYDALIKAAGLEGIENRFFGELSGGQKQRTLFALALAGDPDLIFLDEPTVGLDIEARRLMWAEIRSPLPRRSRRARPPHRRHQQRQGRLRRNTLRSEIDGLFHLIVIQPHDQDHPLLHFAVGRRDPLDPRCHGRGTQQHAHHHHHDRAGVDPPRNACVGPGPQLVGSHQPGPRRRLSQPHQQFLIPNPCSRSQPCRPQPTLCPL
jgi:ABC-type nitrate/sulfonate/bicarbonate transport system ATPase subunit